MGKRMQGTGPMLRIEVPIQKRLFLQKGERKREKITHFDNQPFFVPLFRAYYAVFCDESIPQAPVLYQPPSSTNKLSCVIYGETEPETTVQVIVNGQSQGISEIAGGNWFAKEVILDEGINYITAHAIDITGNVSDSSNQIDIEAVWY